MCTFWNMREKQGAAALPPKGIALHDPMVAKNVSHSLADGRRPPRTHHRKYFCTFGACCRSACERWMLFPVCSWVEGQRHKSWKQCRIHTFMNFPMGWNEKPTKRKRDKSDAQVAPVELKATLRWPIDTFHDSKAPSAATIANVCKNPQSNNRRWPRLFLIALVFQQ